MIAKAKAISHGINCINYITGESENKKHPEKITHICDNLLPPGLDPTGIWNSMRMDSMCHTKLINNVIRIELSPAKEQTKYFSKEDWENLWLDFVNEFDRQELKDKDGKIISPKTNISGSKYTVWLHEDSRSGIPHLHAAICRIDENGTINNDRNIHLRAQRAAEKVALRYGWETAGKVRSVKKDTVEKDCLDVLKKMDKFSFDDYFNRLRNKGYKIKIRQSEDGKIHGYRIEKGRSHFKASEIGKGRHFMASKLESTWKSHHKEPGYKVSENNPDKLIFTDSRSREFERPDYSKPRDNYRKVNIRHDSQIFTRFIPEPVMNSFEKEFDSYEYSNSAALINLSCFFFAVAQGILAMMNTPYYSSGGGGGTSDNDLPRSKDELEEEMLWAIRCAKAARAKIAPVRKFRMRR